MSILQLVLKFERRLMVFILDFSVSCPNTICQRLQGILWKFGICWLTSWLLLMWVSLFLWGVFSVWLWYGLLLILGFLVIFLKSLVGCEEYVECAQALELNGRQVLFECGHERYWYLVIGCCLRFNMCTLLQQFWFLLVPPLGWLIC